MGKVDPHAKDYTTRRLFQLGLTANNVAAELEIHRMTLHRYRQEPIHMPLGVLLRLANILQISPVEYFSKLLEEVQNRQSEG